MTAPARPVALTIAGSDPSGGAGIQGDLKTFAACGVYGAAAIAALTVQNTQGVTDAVGVEPSFVAAQVTAVLDDLPVGAIKTGMLFDAGIIEAVATVLAGRGEIPLVVDPVMVSTSGHRLLKPDAVEAIRTRLLPLATIVTPNGPEAFDLTGVVVTDEESMRKAAEKIAAMGPQGVVIKGGHHRQGSSAIDLLLFDGVFSRFERPWIETPYTHGSGCAFASAITAGLAKGLTVPDAVAEAEAFIGKAIASAYRIGLGINSPVNHFS
ncbi:MAG: bifunctional hydroxymethylpyrimidine kinase/phosphomethylpyrimidine kinase [Nitrospinae bacterium]|nr:bifunctional hydroxymethylpyrimidine kinase/phosphomethylpyrimidine kinase [Nitrospinota bacterium]